MNLLLNQKENMLLQPIINQIGDDMGKIVSVTEAKAKLSSLVSWTKKNKDTVVIQSRGNPQALIIPYVYAEDVEKLIADKRREEAIDRLYQVAAEVRERNKDLSEKDVEELADRVVREVIDDMVEDGSIVFED